MATVKLYLANAKEEDGSLRKREVSIVAILTLSREQRLPHKIVMAIAGIRSYKTLKRYDGKADLKVLQDSLNSMDQQMKKVV